jgi:hypothetical protein
MRILLIFSVLTTICEGGLTAQTSVEVFLPENHALLGRWEAVDVEITADIIEEESTLAIKFVPGENESLFACGIFTDVEEVGDRVWGCPSYFIARLDNNKIKGTLLSTYIPVLEGSEIRFEFKIDESTGILEIKGATRSGYYQKTN